MCDVVVREREMARARARARARHCCCCCRCQREGERESASDCAQIDMMEVDNGCSGSNQHVGGGK